MSTERFEAIDESYVIVEPERFDPLKKDRDAIEAAIDQAGQPTEAYWKLMGMYAAQQFRSQESMRKMMVFFTCVVAVGLVAGLIIGIIGAVDLNNLLHPATSTDNPFGLSTP